MHRRRLIETLLTAPWALSAAAAAPALAGAPKHILVLGGTHFLGPAVVDAAVAAGHSVTLFNRGVSNPELFPHLEKLRGHRSASAEDEDLSALRPRRFDVAIDVWPSDPAMAASAAALLKERVGRYLYVSSVAAYDASAVARPGAEEGARLAAWDGPARIYSRGKAESERRLGAMLGDRLTVVRPGPIKGERDTTPDLLAWLIRAEAGGEHIGPGDGRDPVELVDVKDVARFLMLAIDRGLAGTFNLTGRPMAFRDFLALCNAATGSNARFVWMPEEFLRRQGLETDVALGVFAGNFPLWRPPDAQPGLWQVSSEKAFRGGWQVRPFQETAFDCLRFFRSRRETLDWDDYLPAAKERAVLAAWARRASAGG